MSEQPEKKKRGRKKNSELIKENTIISNNSTVITAPKKRGRKPKGGKIVTDDNINKNYEQSHTQNIILHLKCSIKDIENITDLDNYNPNIGLNNIEPFNSNDLNLNNKLEDIQYEIIDNPNNKFNPINNSNVPINKKNEVSNKEIWNKLSLLSNNLHTNNVNNKKSNCFWCTEPFENPEIYLPKTKNKENYVVYGCFCSPECATAYLFKENIDNTTKFERYHMLNNIYGEVYNYKKNFKPAPPPHYLLDKYYGDLNIDEYRKLFKNERILLVIDKPITRIYPEIFDENNEYHIQNLNDNNKYRLSVNKLNTLNKSNCIAKNFGLTQATV